MILGFTKGFQVGNKRVPTNFENKILENKKIHTIRWDDKGRWREGRRIHFATGVRTTNYNCFSESVCTGTERIEIVGRDIFILDRKLSESEIEELAINDGFDHVDIFWEWFDSYTPFVGKIIHWTDKRYTPSCLDCGSTESIDNQLGLCPDCMPF